MHCTGKVALLTAGLTLGAFSLLSQTKPNPKPSFDVISIKPSPAGNLPRGGGPRGDRFVVTGMTLRDVLQMAYQRTNPDMSSQFEVIGGPSWINSDRYDVEAKVDCSGGPISRDQYLLMLQSLIEDRFQLKAHLESREVPVFEMVVGKDGLKIKPAVDQTPVNPPGPPPPALCGPPPQAQPAPRTVPFDPTKMRGFLSMQYTGSSSTATGNAVPLRMLMSLLRQEMGRAIIDKTNHTELYDFKLQFSRQRLPDTDANA